MRNDFDSTSPVQMLRALQREDREAKLGGGQVPERGAGVRHPWTPRGPAHKQRFLRATPCTSPSCATCSVADVAEQDGDGGARGTAAQLAAIARELFRSEAFAKWLQSVTDLGTVALRADLRRFRPGVDYTVATGAPVDTPVDTDVGNSSNGGAAAAAAPRLDATLCFVDDSDETAAAAWASDDVGGFQCYIAADDEADAAAETYRCACVAAAKRVFKLRCRAGLP